ncbi:MAG: spermidine/putrescine transport system permease protein [Candidatus Kentron sp. G]|nr:MAG: spermidine/putrescine transport system permease protein [Candidatus Kentron sp. G]VFN02683.1 MAG: spermidine/putrescine transport system permease protein [Candidatus Kentron sp. G]VFN04889.1 MAG: spermidine/putrescine transport system permease protein [Candidatus Kentron sp. G]
MKKSRGFPSWPESVRGYGLLLPTLLVLALVMAAPMVVLTALSLWTQTDTGYDTAPTLNNYVTFFDKRIYPLILMRSMKISALVALVTVLLAYPAAYFIAFHVTRHKMAWLILITLPFWTSYLLRVFAWKLILGYNGVINSGLLWLGVIEQPLDFLLYNASAVVVTLAHAWAAFAILPIYISLSKIDRSLLEAAHDLGEGPVMTFLRVTLPLSLPGVIAAALLVFIPTVGDYVTPKLVGGTTGIMIGNLIQSAFGRGDDWPLGAAISVVSMGGITLAVCVFLLGMGRLKALVR